MPCNPPKSSRSIPPLPTKPPSPSRHQNKTAPPAMPPPKFHLPLTPLHHLLRPSLPTTYTHTHHFLPLIPLRHATHASEGRANKASQGPGKRLGAKKSATELVVPGNIIFRQRGTHWFPGENCGMGRDHTIHATAKGYVTYYKDVDRHPGRKYIGVVFERGMTLPRGKGAARRRRLGFVGRRRDMGTLAAAATATGDLEGIGEEEEVRGVQDIGDGGGNIVMSMPSPHPASTVTKEEVEEEPPKAKKGYMYRPTNYEIGRAIEKKAPAVLVQELLSASRREEGGAEQQQQRARNKFHAWHLRQLLWRKESERRFNIKKGRGKKKKR